MGFKFSRLQLNSLIALSVWLTFSHSAAFAEPLSCFQLLLGKRNSDQNVIQRQNPYDPGAQFQPFYSAPNEPNPKLVLPKIKQHREGALLSVGTERALMTAALAENVNYIVQFDHDPRVIRYNTVNKFLLQAAMSREQYVSLRLNSNYIQWVLAAKKANLATPSYSDYSFWRKALRATEFEPFHSEKPMDTVLGIAFEDANYLYNDNAFEKVKSLADQNRIEIIQMNLAEPETFDPLLARLEASVGVSIIDVSNAWSDMYAGRRQVNSLSIQLKAIQPEALIVFTSLLSLYDDDSQFTYWKYRSVQAGELIPKHEY